MTPSMTLSKTVKKDLETLFHFQLNEEACHLAAFMPEDHRDMAAYINKYEGFLARPDIHMRTIRLGDAIAGSISKFVMEGDAEITYWLDRKFWGRGLATAALSAFLELEKTRPLFGRVAFDNYGSQKVLEKCGFARIGADRGFASARGAEIEEYIYKLS